MTDNIIWLHGQPKEPVDNTIQSVLDFIAAEKPESLVLITVENNKPKYMIANNIESTTLIGLLEMAKANIIDSEMYDDQQEDIEDDE
jgi:S-adenosylmethionine synthetase